MKKENRKEKMLEECKWLFKKTINHRGKFDNVKVFENTIEAYKKSIEMKYPFELDVQLTGDGQVVCFHDGDLKRMFNRERKVLDISYKRLNKLRDDFQVPLFKDVLNLVDGKVELMIELKHVNHKANKMLITKVAELLKDYKGKYVVVSFNPFMVASYRRVDKKTYVGRIASANKKYLADKGIYNLIAKPDFISYDINSYSEETLNKYKKKGYKLVGWTLKNKEDVKQLKKYFDNFIVEGDF